MRVIKGSVLDWGGGVIEVVIDRDTAKYPATGARVFLVVEEPEERGEEAEA